MSQWFADSVYGQQIGDGHVYILHSPGDKSWVEILV